MQIREILEARGAEHQQLHAIGELSELSRAITKHLQAPSETTLMECKQEIADCFNMLSQLRIIYKIKPSELHSIMEAKQERELERIKNE